MTFKSLNIDFNIYKEKILPYINKSYDGKPVVAEVGSSKLHHLKNGVVQVDYNLEENKVRISINDYIMNNKSILSDLEKLIGEKIN